MSRDFTNLSAVTAGEARVAGTTIGRENRQWLVSALGFEVDIEIESPMVLLRCGLSFPTVSEAKRGAFRRELRARSWTTTPVWKCSWCMANQPKWSSLRTG